MAQEIMFGTGLVTAVRTDISNPTPALLGIVQDVDFGFDFTNKKLMGQYQLAVDVARGSQAMTAKIKFARVYSGIFDLFFGQGVTPSAGQQIYPNEPHTVASTTQTVSHVSGGIVDLGVFYTSTGTQLTRVAPSSEATGKYSVNLSTGVYTFAVADEVPLLFNYVNAVTSLNQLTLTNQLAGTGPTFALYMYMTYKGNFCNFVLNQCTSSKLSNPFKNQDYMISEIDVDIFADASNNIGTMSFSQ